MLRSRTLIGAICIILSVLLFFGILPFFVRIEKKETAVPVACRRIGRGTLVTADMIETVMMPSAVPGSVTDAEQIVGKYASSDIPKGDIFLAEKLSTDGSGTAEVLGSLKEGECALTVQVTSFSGAFSGQLTNGDVVRVYVSGPDGIYVPDTLRYVQVISTVSSDGVTRDRADEGTSGEVKPAASVMFRVCDKQALTLFALGPKTSYHCAFICHGNDPRAEGLLAAQRELIESAEEEAKAADTDGSAEVTDDAGGAEGGGS
ncbi:MAG: hypothetical protein J6V01_05970 [Clostridia bacterium]|nr:hypothetical protein [Clostridia bacterium]